MNAYVKSEHLVTNEDGQIVLGDHAETGLVSSDYVDRIISDYRQREQAIYETKQFLTDAEKKGVIAYFIQGAAMGCDYDQRAFLPTCEVSAIKALRVEYWARVLNEVKVFDLMPAEKRIAARNQFSGADCPPFDESTVRPTILDLLSQRQNFFCERIDGIFRGLSKTHYTNQPSGFSKKMIIASVFDSYDLVDSSKCALINDLRGVVGRLNGRGEPKEYDTRKILAAVRRNHIGEKVSIDGGAFTIKVFKVGTVHFEVAPEIADKLNEYLATLYPAAIPSNVRPKKKSCPEKSFFMRQEMLPMEVIAELSNLKLSRDNRTFLILERKEKLIAPLMSVLSAIGAMDIKNSGAHISCSFDYNPSRALDQIMVYGALPDVKSHQFYPSKGEIGELAAELLGATEADECLEPSAGNADLARHLPGNTLCIEISKLRSEILKAKGYRTENADFIQWAKQNAGYRADKILMNPPFANGRAKLHVETALELLTGHGRLVAIVPASMHKNYEVEGFNIEWAGIHNDMFDGTSVSVAIMLATRK